MAQYVEGVDVSHHQENRRQINFAVLAQTDTKFVIHKLTEGVTGFDNNFPANWQESKAQGFILSLYHFYKALKDPVLQAQNLVRHLPEKFGPGQVRYVLDLEWDLRDVNDPHSDMWLEIPRLERIRRVAAFVAELKKQTGVSVLIYGGFSFLDPTFPVTEIDGFKLTDHDLWAVDYRKGRIQPQMPQAWAKAGKSWRFWQYTGKGLMAGINSVVDRNRFNGSLDDLKAFAGQPG